MKLIIAEKPSVASNIAQALGAKTKQDGYFEDNGYFVSFVFGHLYTFADVKDYIKKLKMKILIPLLKSFIHYIKDIEKAICI